MADVGDKELAIRLCVAVLSVACYANSCWGEFVFDDSEAIVGNSDVDPSRSTLRQLFSHDFWGESILANTSHKSYRPLTTLTFRLNHWLAGGLVPVGFHIANVVLHALVSLLYLEVCIALCARSSMKPSARKTVSVVAALLFSVHPVHTETVAGIVGRAELASAMCFFLAIFCYMRACDAGSRRSHRWRYYRMACWLLLTILAALCALLFKEQGITVMGLCIVYEVILNMKMGLLNLIMLKDFNRLRMPVVRVSVILAAAVVLTAARLSVGSPTFKPIDNAALFADSLLTRVLTYNYIYGLNAWILLHPWWLCFDWSMGCVPLLNSLSDYRVCAVAAFWLVGGSVACYCLLAKNGPTKRIVTVSLAMMVVPFLPASNVFVGVGFVVAERVLYLPSAGFCLLVATGVASMSRYLSKWIWLQGVVFLTTVFMIRSITRSSQWLDGERLFTSGYAVCPLNAKVLYNIGKVKSDRGDMIVGEAAYREAIRLYPEYDQALNNLGNILKDHGEAGEAEKLFLRALSANQKYPAAWMNLGIAQAALGKLKEAEESYRKAITLRKKYPDAYYNLGNLYKDLGQHEAAISAYETAIGLNREHTSSWNNYGLLYEEIKAYDKAEEIMRLAISEVPGFAQFYSSLGVMLGKQNRLKEAQELLEKAVALEPNSGNYLANLGVVYHLQKDYKKAEKTYELALKRQPDLKLARENFQKLLSTKQKFSS